MTYKRKCSTCRGPFTTIHPTKQYCTKRCKSRADKLRKRYQVTPNQIYIMFKTQKGKCAICSARGDVQELGFKKYRAFCIDHDHKTGNVRALLCRDCNLGLGMFKDCQAFLLSAIAYLIKHSPIKKKATK